MLFRSRYDHAIDTRKVEEWADTFVDEGSWDGGIKVEGKEALLAFGHGLPTNPVFGPFTGARHLNTNFVIEETAPGEARLRCDNLMTIQRDGRVEIVALAGYDDRVVRRDGRWLFLSRKWRPVRA